MGGLVMLALEVLNTDQYTTPGSTAAGGRT